MLATPKPKKKTARDLTPEEMEIILDPRLDYRAITDYVGISRSYVWKLRKEAGLIPDRRGSSCQ
jgi:hypothetical protein